MRSLTLCSSALTLVLFAPPAAAAIPVTTGETDSGGVFDYVVIVEPLDGAVLPGTPDAVVPVVMEFKENLLGGEGVDLVVDDGPSQSCSGQESPCTLEVTLAPGPHTLVASVNGDSHAISITVEDNGTATTGSDTTGSATDSTGDATDATDSGATSEATGGTEATSSTGDTNSDGASGGDSGGDKGCACSTRSTSAPDLLALAFAALLAPWRRRRNR